jgi:lipoprotein-anchoring transpeptidase ErfK/SrfK
VFYGGYALHSTLLNYNGTEYDGTVRAMISHGCIRLHPEDINWIAARIPVGTKIYITG